MNTKKRSSILSKTRNYIMFFCIAILCFLWCVEIFFFRVFYEKYQIKTVTKIATKLLKSEFDGHDEIISKYAYENNVCISLYNAYGDVKDYNIQMNGCGLKTINATEAIYKFINGNNNQVAYQVGPENDIKGFMYAVKNKEMDIFVYAPIEDVTIATQLMRSQLIYFTIISIILSSIVAIYLSRILTKPIRKITKNALNLGKENYDNAFEESGILEIDELNDTLNTVQEELGKVQTYQKDLLANVSHDLKTPLTMIKAYAEKIKDISYKDKNKLDQDIEIIVDETERLTTLVNDILDLSKIQNSKKSISLDSYDLIAEIKNIIKKYEIIKETENYCIELISPSKAMVIADKNKINQVIYNLVNNAINYTGKDQKVIISVEDNHKNYTVKIIDSGKGIKETEIKNIWNKYYKNDKNHKRNVISTGLGLSIVKEILEAHKFKYGVHSIIDKGSTFYFTIPKNSSKKHIKNTKID